MCLCGVFFSLKLFCCGGMFAFRCSYVERGASRSGPYIPTRDFVSDKNMPADFVMANSGKSIGKPGVVNCFVVVSS